jgi:O-antigen ligase
MRLLVAGLIVVSISRIHQSISVIGLFRPALLLVGLAAAYAFLNPRKLAPFAILRTFPARMVMALGVMACISAPFGISLGSSASFILQDYSKVLLAAFLILITIRNVADLYTYIWAFAISTGLLAFTSVFISGVSVTSDGLARLSGSASYDANDTGTVILVGLTLTLIVFQMVRGVSKVALVGVLLLSGATLAKTGSRGAFVGLVAVGGALLVLLDRVSIVKRVGVVVVLVLGLAVAAPQGYWDQMGSLLSPKEDYNWTSPTGRKAVTTRGIGYMMRNPITGIGVGNFPRAEGLLSERGQAFRPGLKGVKWSAAHNSFLQPAAEMGIPGFVLFCMLVFGSMRLMFRLRKRLPKQVDRADPEMRLLTLAALYLPVALIAFAVAGFFVSFAYLDLLYMLSAIVAGTIFCIETRLGARPASGRAPAAAAPAPVPAHRAATGRRIGGFVPHRMRR